ncbi:MAG: aminotransferase class I/II-fold pyridoxal phosphate-dependent enzyme [Acidobacteriia bacterium]|nr:aminotransferase class I/II-fold pyridoxal phosphate-dependent enzyme [Methyloceanibacter sp.]MBX5472104.1 aminotransferase class I/II-fold pyridoxal phosphate-dependent enzyme [Acetobacteraceae bacterium]MCL6490460.1 aminotransferase class I/II-fold pyridoxal phosphate-dependent enzyme [Terriglobia bacterium]
MTLKIGRAAHGQPFMVMDVIAAANAQAAKSHQERTRVLRMEVGQPATGAPAGAITAVKAALASGRPLGYTEALGLPSLRARIAQHYLDWYGLKVSPERIAVTTGASGAFPLAFLAAFDPGDRIALAAPYYPPYVNILIALGLTPVILETEAERGFQPSLSALKRLDPPPEGLILASPANPTGAMLTPEEFSAIVAWCDAEKVRLLSDEIYHGISYGAPFTTAAATSPNAIVVNSFSKYFSMTGWRIGWMVLPEELVRPVEQLAQNFFISAPHISQIAAEAAFDCESELSLHIARYRRARALLLEALPRAGFRIPSSPDGAFYIYADIGARDEDSVRFCTRMLTEIGIAATPGVDFDQARGRRFVRFSYAGPEADMQEAAERLIRWG